MTTAEHQDVNGGVEISIEKRNAGTTDESIKGKANLKNLEEVQGEQKSKMRKGKSDTSADTCNCSIF